VEVAIEPGLAACADPPLVRLVLDNLLSNAFKYSSRRPDARVRMGQAERREGEATFFISDNGAGFDPAEAHRLFRPLVRLHPDSDFPGTGLGLASVARIVELHGGRVRAEGCPGAGATFYFSLPAAS
jgi:signal transduction histidine kinase